MKPRSLALVGFGAVAVVAGALLVAVGRQADVLGFGGTPGMAWKQTGAVVAGALAVAAGVASIAFGLGKQGRRAVFRWVAQPSRLVPFLLAATVYLGAFFAMNPPPTGDQPHYMIEAYSLTYDRDRDLSNDYFDPYRFGPMFGPFVAEGHAHAFTDEQRESGTATCVHNVGLPALLVPAVLVTHDVRAMRVELILLAAIAAYLLLGIMRRLPIGRGWILYAVWGLVVFSLPFVAYSAQVWLACGSLRISHGSAGGSVSSGSTPSSLNDKGLASDASGCSGWRLGARSPALVVQLRCSEISFASDTTSRPAGVSTQL